MRKRNRKHRKREQKSKSERLLVLRGVTFFPNQLFHERSLMLGEETAQQRRKKSSM